MCRVTTGLFLRPLEYRTERPFAGMPFVAARGVFVVSGPILTGAAVGDENWFILRSERNRYYELRIRPQNGLETVDNRDLLLLAASDFDPGLGVVPAAVPVSEPVSASVGLGIGIPVSVSAPISAAVPAPSSPPSQ